MSNILSINNRKYLDVELVSINQKDKIFYVGKIKARDLLEIYTVRPARYDFEKNISMAKSFPSEQDYYNHLISQNKQTISDRDFQRKYSETRVNDISKFLNNEEYAFFPNTIIVNCELINDVEAYDLEESTGLDSFRNILDPPSHLSLLYTDNSKNKLLVPFTKDAILIIDGQHRIEGLKKAKDDIIDNYELLLAFIIGYDRSVIAQQFYTINYEQKPVNRSLLYHLMGEFSTELDELTFFHKVVKALNELEISPFYKRIKMLGVAPQNMSADDKKLLSISLAFLIDALIKSISKNSTRSIYQPIFRYYYVHEKYQIEIIRVLLNYFSAVKDIVPNWANPSESLASKGMGVGALIKTLQLLFPIIFVREWNKDPSKIQQLDKNSFLSYLKGLENVDFSKNGPFGGSGSAGSINKIKETIVENVDYFDETDYSEFEYNFKKEGGVLSQFKSWIDNHLQI